MLLSADKLSLGFGTTEPLLQDMDLKLAEGERLLVCGATGSGKSTLMMALSGVTPQISPIAHYSGSVMLEGEGITQLSRDDLFSRVGYVAQSAEDQLWDLSVEDIIAFPLENRAMPRDTVRDRVRWLMEHLELTELAGRRVLSLSGGERRMVVLAAALASRPRLLVLDEPTTGLDPAARERLCRALQQAAEDVSGVIVAEQDPVHLASVMDSLAFVSNGALSPAMPLASALDDVTLWSDAGLLPPRKAPWRRTRPTPGAELMRIEQLRSRLTRASGKPVLESVNLSLHAGEVLGIIGRNGAGKTSLMKAVLGLIPTTDGQITLAGQSARDWTTAKRARHIAYVPQSMRQILFHMTTAEEVAFARSMGKGTEEIEVILSRYGLDGQGETNPFALSARQQGQLGLACAEASGASIAIVDEPLLARDLEGRAFLETFLERMTDQGRAVMLVSHDLELIDDVASRLALVDDGRVAYDGSLAQGWQSPAFDKMGWPAPYAATRESAA